MKKTTIIILLLSICLFIAACGGGGGGASSSNAPPTPTVATVEPQNNSTLSTLPKTISVTFSGAMDSATITGSTFIVTSNGQPVNGTVTYSSDNKTAIFTPSSDLETTTTYTCTVTTGVKNSSGRNLTSNYIWQFSTDTVPLSPAISHTALGNSVSIAWSGVQGASTYNLYWSESSPSTTAGLSFPNVITNVGSSPFTQSNLLSGKTYYYSVTAVNAKGESNYSNVESVTLDASNGTAVTSTSPGANETDVPINDTWNWTPNKLTIKAMYNSQLTASKPIMSVVESNCDPVEIVSSSDADPRVVSYNLTSDLKYNTTYTVTLSGNASGSDYSWKFTTVESAPILSYKVTPPHRYDISWTPVKGATSYNFVFFWLDSIFDPRATAYTGLTAPFYLAKPIITADHSQFYYWIVAVKGTKPISISNSILLTGIP